MPLTGSRKTRYEAIRRRQEDLPPLTDDARRVLQLAIVGLGIEEIGVFTGIRLRKIIDILGELAERIAPQPEARFDAMTMAGVLEAGDDRPLPKRRQRTPWSQDGAYRRMAE